jgi:glucosamine kinase
MAATQDRLILGVDAGATRCRARLRGARGERLAEAEGPAANAYVDFDAAIRVARDCVIRTLAAAGMSAMCTSSIKLGLGVAGVSSAADARTFASAFPEFASPLVVNDVIAACAGAHGGADGGLVIAGTGTAGVARVGDQQTIVGGRGFLLGDDGSAARIGADAVRAALRAHDGLSPETALTVEIRRSFGDDPLAMTSWATQAKPGDYGAFAPRVLQAAEAGDAMALAIVETAAQALCALVTAVEAAGARRVAMIGGLSAPIRPFLPPAMGARLQAPLFDPIDGAILLAGGVVEAPA